LSAAAWPAANAGAKVRLVLGCIYGREVTGEDICTVIYFSPVDKYEL